MKGDEVMEINNRRYGLLKGIGFASLLHCDGLVSASAARNDGGARNDTGSFPKCF